ncbi:MAG: hypothetical protein VKL60_02840, partial [Sphaerospermopsis sp.]|nr:hypothetical protein [Sphaerospermopsis sp.]
MSAQTCVQNLSINLGRSCEINIDPAMVALGLPAGTFYVRINDNSPNDSKVNQISPVTGWTYGLFKQAGSSPATGDALICQGTIITYDDAAPVFSAAQKAAWDLIDTVVTWADNLNEIQDQAQFGSANYGTAPVTLAADLNTSSKRASFTAAFRWHTGRPWMSDSCEYSSLSPGTLTSASTRILDLDNDGTGASEDADDNVTIHRSRNLQVKVTDYLESPQCDSSQLAALNGQGRAFSHKIRRSWQFIDQRGNDTTINQIIYFVRPSLRGDNAAGDGFTRVAQPAVMTGVTGPSYINRGPGNLGQFGPFGNIGRRKFSSNAGDYPRYGESSSSGTQQGSSIAKLDYSTTFLKLGRDWMSTKYGEDGTTNKPKRDTIEFRLGTALDLDGNAVTDCYNFNPATELRPLLACLYVASDTLPSGFADSISLFSDQLKSQFSVEHSYTEYPECGIGKKIEARISVFDWCSGTQEFDTLIIKFVDKSAPVFATYNASNQNTETNASTTGRIKGRATAGNGGTRGSNDSVIVSVGLNDCTASLRMPSKSGTSTRSNLRDLSSLFNWGVYDECGAQNNTDRNGIKVSLNYRFQTRDAWNNGFYIDRDDWSEQNYTVVEMGGGPVALGLPIGEHRVLIEAWDECNNKAVDTLYFDVQDMVAPTMKCDDQLNITLTSNSTTNYFINGRGSVASTSDREITRDQVARIYVADINEGSKDNCTLDSMYVRRRVHKDCISTYFSWNMDYDIFGDNNGRVDLNDFTRDGTTDFYFTPKYMQYVEFTCCDGNPIGGTQQMVELWGSDLVQGILGNSDINAPAGRNWSWCWGNVQIEDKTAPVITPPDLKKNYNVSNPWKGTTRSVRNWVECKDKEIIGTATNNKDGEIADVNLSNQLFGYPDIYGIECTGTVDYEVRKVLVCDTGYIDRVWTVTKKLGDGKVAEVAARQRIWVKASHDFTITVPADVTSANCSNATFGDISFDENGCDLLAVSGVNTKVYSASDPSENTCKKIYRTWTVINWCMVPNQLTCENADPASYARVIPRLTRTQSVSSGNWSYQVANSTNGDAISVLHRMYKPMSNTSERNIGLNGNGQGFSKWALNKTSNNTNADGSLDAEGRPSRANSADIVVFQPYSTSLTAFTGTSPSRTNNPLADGADFAFLYGWLVKTTDYKKDTLSANSLCNALGEQSFAWTYTQVVKLGDNTKPTVDVVDKNTNRKFTASSDGEVRWDAAKETFAIRGASNCTAKVKFQFTVSDDCPLSGPFAADITSYIAKAETPLVAVAGTGLKISPVDPGTDAKTFTVEADNLASSSTGRQTYHLLLNLRDDCGNLTQERIPFTVGDLKAPAPVCVQNLTATLMPDGSGGCMVVVKAIDV